MYLWFAEKGILPETVRHMPIKDVLMILNSLGRKNVEIEAKQKRINKPKPKPW